MKFLVSLFLVFASSTYCFSFMRFIYVEAKVVSCQNFTFDVIVHAAFPKNIDVLIGGVELVYGDGTREEVPLDRKDFTQINKDLSYYKIVRRHAYQGPGNYTISARVFNRLWDIENMARSVNTPLYVETKINLDPFIGCNNTPEVENIPGIIFKSYRRYFHDFSVIDQENDSISFSLTTALQDKNIPAIDYELVSEYNDLFNKKISIISIDPYTGLHFFNTKHTTGAYSIVMKMIEWRKIGGTYHKISQTMIDYTIELFDTENQPPDISGIKDTVLIVGNNYVNQITVTDPDNDSIQMLVNGDFFRLSDVPPGNNHELFPGPINYQLNFTPLEKHIRSRPYKILISANDQNENYSSLYQTQSMYVWITDREHIPGVPPKLISQILHKNIIGIYWNDTEYELGYILERADLHFPEYEKIAILPANSTYFIDSGAVENNTYTYRIKAVGTQMSNYTYGEISTPDIITAINTPDDDKPKIYPNPSAGYFTISAPGNYDALHIVDITGNTVLNQTLTATHHLSTSLYLPSGIYILKLYDAGKSDQFKLQVLP